MLYIPPQLQKPEFRFIRIDMEGPSARKKPLDIDWQNTNNYILIDKILRDWVMFGNNYGVVCGYGNLAVIDSDDPEIDFIVLNRLPKTFTVMTGSGGKHYYYIIDDLEKKFVLQKLEQSLPHIKNNDNGLNTETHVKHYGEIQWKGSQVVGPNSIHPNGNRYLVVGDYPIATISNQHIREIFGDYIRKDEPKREYTGENPHQYIDLSKIINLENFRQKGGECVGKHPIHGSSTGGNFSVNIERGLFHCFRCGTGGGAVSLIAMLNGLIKCSDIRIGCITPEIREQVVQIAKIKYNLIIED